MLALRFKAALHFNMCCLFFACLSLRAKTVAAQPDLPALADGRAPPAGFLGPGSPPAAGHASPQGHAAVRTAALKVKVKYQ